MEGINFVSSYLLNELSKWAQFRLILKSWLSSLKWAQIEVNSSIRLGATVFQSLCYFISNGKNPYNFISSYLLNELSKWAQFRLILKNWHSPLKWAQIEVNSSIRLRATVFQSWCNFIMNGKNPCNLVISYLLYELSYWAQFRLMIIDIKETRSLK